jgi:hypothetical protein
VCAWTPPRAVGASWRAGGATSPSANVPSRHGGRPVGDRRAVFYPTWRLEPMMRVGPPAVVHRRRGYFLFTGLTFLRSSPFRRSWALPSRYKFSQHTERKSTVGTFLEPGQRLPWTLVALDQHVVSYPTSTPTLLLFLTLSSPPSSTCIFAWFFYEWPTGRIDTCRRPPQIVFISVALWFRFDAEFFFLSPV